MVKANLLKAPLVFAAGLFLLLSALVLNAQQVITVDNQGGPHADYTSLQAAIDAAEDGAIIHVLGSPVSYGEITVTRQVHLFGPGYNQGNVYQEGYQLFHDAELFRITFLPTRTPRVTEYPLIMRVCRCWDED